MKLPRSLLVVFLMTLSAGLVSKAEAADGPFRIQVATEARVHLAGDKISVLDAKAKSAVEKSAAGTEESSCTPYGRRSATHARASADVIERSDSTVRLHLNVDVMANGGHYRTCLLGCGFGQCLGIHGNDTRAQASALANAVLTIEFSSEFPPADYELDFAVNNNSAGFTVELKDASGSAIPVRREEGRPQLLRGRPGAVYFLNLNLPVEANDAGGCCSDRKSGSSTIMTGIRIQKAPIIDARGEFVPFIAGGMDTTAYPNVGAIRIENKLHCTATVLSKKSILTAAHCVDGFEERLLASGQFLIGSNITQPDEAAMDIAGFDFPKHDTAFSYDPKTYKNDVAIIHLKTATKVAPVELHSGIPSWDEIISKNINLTFVGFGYEVVGKDRVGIGIKRESSWKMRSADTSTVHFAAGDRGTCKGDSGGPAFLIGSGKIQQVAITSGSYSYNCKDGGVETRIDYFLPWIKGRLAIASSRVE